VNHPDFVEPLVLIKNGMDNDLAFAMNWTMRKAAVIAFGMLNGGRWNWDTMSWIEDRQ
jgi:hypothetical protein